MDDGVSLRDVGDPIDSGETKVFIQSNSVALKTYVF